MFGTLWTETSYTQGAIPHFRPSLASLSQILHLLVALGGIYIQWALKGQQDGNGDMPCTPLSCGMVNLMMKQSPYILPSLGRANGFINTRPRASKRERGKRFTLGGE